MRADRHNSLIYLGSWLAVVAAIWGVLMAYGKENPWIDRLIAGEIAICAAIAVGVIFWYTEEWTARVIGIFSLMLAIVILYSASQLLDAGVWGEPLKPAQLPPGFKRPPAIPYWLRSVWRTLLAVAGPCLLWGYLNWFREENKRI